MILKKQNGMHDYAFVIFGPIFFSKLVMCHFVGFIFFKHLNQYEKGCFKYFVTFAISLNIIVD